MGSRTWSDEELVAAVPLAQSMMDLLRRLGLRVTGGNPISVRKHIARLGLSTSHFNVEASRKALGSHQFRPTLKYDDIFKQGSTVSSYKVSQYLVKHGLMLYLCVLCGNTGQHNGKPLVLQLDHKNGDPADNRMENVRFLCPNCHTQTDNFAGRSTNRRPRKKESTTPCRAAAQKVDYTLLAHRYAEVGSYTEVARELQVSDVTVRKAVIRSRVV